MAFPSISFGPLSLRSTKEAFQLPLANITWKAALEAGWNDEQLAEAFATVGATVFTAYFLNYAKT
jgi:hypothetical protein